MNQRTHPVVEHRDFGSFPDKAELVIVGAGAAGLVCALAAREANASVLLIERDDRPTGSTSLSAGLIPAAGTRWQRDAGIHDSTGRFVEDIITKSRAESDRPLATTMAGTVPGVLHWLADRWDVPLDLVDGFTYPGHSVRRMHGTPMRTGAELLGALLRAVSAAGADLVTGVPVSHLYRDAQGLSGVGRAGPGGVDAIGTRRVVLACNGFGGNPAMVARYLGNMSGALYFGHSGNTGDAIGWGEKLGAGLHNMAACQGHGSVASPHGILISWAVVMEGGFQVNRLGERFSNEHRGYSEQAVSVLAQPDGLAWSVFDQRIHDIAMQFEDFRQAVQVNAVRRADSPRALAETTGLPPPALLDTFAEVDRLALVNGCDRFGRRFEADKRLSAPLYAVRVEGALFHTQGGLRIDRHARVLDTVGKPIQGLYAAGGAACGVSGNSIDGYLSGNGLLSAVTTGYLAGCHAVNNN